VQSEAVAEPGECISAGLCGQFGVESVELLVQLVTRWRRPVGRARRTARSVSEVVVRSGLHTSSTFSCSPERVARIT